MLATAGDNGSQTRFRAGVGGGCGAGNRYVAVGTPQGPSHVPLNTLYRKGQDSEHNTGPKAFLPGLTVHCLSPLSAAFPR